MMTGCWLIIPTSDLYRNSPVFSQNNVNAYILKTLWSHNMITLDDVNTKDLNDQLMKVFYGKSAISSNIHDTG